MHAYIYFWAVQQDKFCLIFKIWHKLLFDFDFELGIGKRWCYTIIQ